MRTTGRKTPAAAAANRRARSGPDTGAGAQPFAERFRFPGAAGVSEMRRPPGEPSSGTTPGDGRGEPCVPALVTARRKVLAAPFLQGLAALGLVRGLTQFGVSRRLAPLGGRSACASCVRFLGASRRLVPPGRPPARGLCARFQRGHRRASLRTAGSRTADSSLDFEEEPQSAAFYSTGTLPAAPAIGFNANHGGASLRSADSRPADPVLDFEQEPRRPASYSAGTPPAASVLGFEGTHWTPRSVRRARGPPTRRSSSRRKPQGAALRSAGTPLAATVLDFDRNHLAPRSARRANGLRSLLQVSRRPTSRPAPLRRPIAFGRPRSASTEPRAALRSEGTSASARAPGFGESPSVPRCAPAVMDLPIPRPISRF